MKAWILCLMLLVISGRIFGADPNLSDAMKAAASGDRTPIAGSHSGHSDHSDYSDDNDSLAGSIFSSIFEGLVEGIIENFHGARYSDREYFWQLPVDTEYVAPLNGSIRGITRFSITPLSLEGEGAFFGFYFNGGIVDMKPNTLPDTGTSMGWTVGCGAAFRYYFVKSKKPFNPYLSARVGWQELNWDYRHPIVLGSGETVSSDSLSGLDSYVGFGIVYHRSEWFSLYGEVGFGGTFFSDETPLGFHNDVFNDYGYLSVKAGLSLKF
jgi:hypothetical protein